MTLPKGILGYHPPIETRPVKVWTEELGERVPLKSNSPNQWIAKTGMALRVLMGSSVYGTSVENKGDRDELGICVEPPQYVIGNKVFKPYIFRTVEERKPVKNGISPCSEPGDLDLMVHSLRHYIYLAAAGNPTMLTPLFVPDSAVLYANDFGRELREYKDMILSRRMAAKYKGYLHSQRRGLLGLRSGGTRNMGRRDIREEMGWDAKFGTHMVRLGYEGVLLLENGVIQLPLPEPYLTNLRELRRGERTKEWALSEAEKYEEKLSVLESTSKLPDAPDWQRINSWLIDVHLRHWGLK